MDMTLKDYAKRMGVCYRTAYNHHCDGRLDSYKSESGSIFVRDPEKLDTVKELVLKLIQVLNLDVTING
jgi:predicted site-specific integrase-resolvase